VLGEGNIGDRQRRVDPCGSKFAADATGPKSARTRIVLDFQSVETMNRSPAAIRGPASGRRFGTR
jgi:hypothetical protein